MPEIPDREQRENEHFISRFEEIADATAQLCSNPVVNDAYRLMFAQRDRIRQLEQAADGATAKTEWGVRYDDQGNVGIYGTSSDHERWARMDADGVLVCRTVTYGPWREPVQEEGDHGTGTP